VQIISAFAEIAINAITQADKKRLLIDFSFGLCSTHVALPVGMGEAWRSSTGLCACGDHHVSLFTLTCWPFFAFGFNSVSQASTIGADDFGLSSSRESN
jgi:hypothetical protein